MICTRVGGTHRSPERIPNCRYLEWARGCLRRSWRRGSGACSGGEWVGEAAGAATGVERTATVSGPAARPHQNMHPWGSTTQSSMA